MRQRPSCCRKYAPVLAAAILSWMPLLAQTDGESPPFEGGIVERSGVTVMLVDVEVTDEDGAPLPPTTQSPRMIEILERVANVAKLYRDNALRFTCDETIHYSGYGAPIRHKFRYLYRYSKTDDALRDYRVPRSGEFDPEVDRVDLASYGLPVFMLRAYSWLFIFLEGNQQLYRFKLAGEEQVLRRSAVRIDFEPIPPYEPEVNDWFGSAWVDRETYQLLRVEAVRPEDREQQRLAEIAAKQEREGYMGTYPVAHYSTDFDVEKNGMRFPGRALIEGTQLHVRGGQIVEAPVFHVKQTYKRYRFFGVRTAQEIRERTRGKD